MLNSTHSITRRTIKCNFFTSGYICDRHSIGIDARIARPILKASISLDYHLPIPLLGYKE